ncbi:hypothetical protein BGZ61DRAFT_296253, partial [Ilyonectria robusta]|uniref:uncharacterized protein n=1 Tax=Ilyonectria robusta TaxID=1079257 RepID=UPI001E8CB65B
MCNYIYKEFSCQHHYQLVEFWCPKYIEIERRCLLTIVRKQYWSTETQSLNFPGACRERHQHRNRPWLKWLKLIERPQSRM